MSGLKCLLFVICAKQQTDFWKNAKTEPYILQSFYAFWRFVERIAVIYRIFTKI